MNPDPKINEGHSRVLILWDIDGTLMRQFDRSALFIRALEPWVSEEFRASWKPVPKGLTDSHILGQGLKDAGFSSKDVDSLLPSACRQLGLCQEIDSPLISDQSPILPGVRDALAQKSIGKHPVVHTLATGNTYLRALLKVRSHGLLESLAPHLGCYGDDASDRAEMVSVGLDRICLWERIHDVTFSATFIVGDSVHDVTAAKRNGIPSIAVLTSGESRDELLSHGATTVVSTAAEVIPAIERHLDQLTIAN